MSHESKHPLLGSGDRHLADTVSWEQQRIASWRAADLSLGPGVIPHIARRHKWGCCVNDVQTAGLTGRECDGLGPWSFQGSCLEHNMMYAPLTRQK